MAAARMLLIDRAEPVRNRKLHYPRAKAIVRGLVAWRILVRTPAGLTFQPNSTKWRPPSVHP